MEKIISIPQCNTKASYLQYKREIDSAITRVLDNGNYILGSEVDAFEAEFASFTGAQYAAGVANGTDALEIALRAIGARQSDIILATANAGGYARTAAERIGCVTHYIDTE